MFKLFIKKALLYIVIMAVLITLYQLLTYRGTCFLSEVKCSEVKYLIQTVPLGILYVTPFTLLFAFTQARIHLIRQRKGWLEKK